MARTPSQAVAYANRQGRWKSGMCLQFVRTCFGVGSRYGSASIGWRHTKYRHTSVPPPGVPVWWTGGSRGFGHIAISVGGGYVRSTDFPGSGRVGKVAIKTLTRRWRQTYRGWSEDINGVRVWRPTAARAPARAPAAARKPVRVKPLVDASVVAKYARSGRGAPGSSGVLIVQAALAREISGYSNAGGPGYFGPRTRRAYAAWQRRLGYSGSDADGIPGFGSLSKLGAKYGFRVQR
jgi:hypothetical protein